jgi:NAD(P) transhydrogenase
MLWGEAMSVAAFSTTTILALDWDKTHLVCLDEIAVAWQGEIARVGMLSVDSGLVMLLLHREGYWLLDVHAIGAGVTELIHIGQAVLGLNGGSDYFLDTVFNYPTLAECYKVAPLNASNKLRR